MLARSLRHLLDGGGGDNAGVTLSAFRTRTPDSDCGPLAPEPDPVTLWEEADEGVLYTVTSRTPGGTSSSKTSLQEQEQEEEAAVPSSTVQSRALKAGTLPRLVRHLLDAPALGDTCFVPAFLATYRTFASPPEVLRLLLDRLQEVTGPGSNPAPETTELRRSLRSLLCSAGWLSQRLAGGACLARAAVVYRMRWALGRGSDPEKTPLLAFGTQGGPPKGPRRMHGGATEAARTGGTLTPTSPGLQAEAWCAHLTAPEL
ncbi:ral guanine nucleotide dissociation stimulator-like 2 [Sceloporus undulatus]|uniref:ral guanine nucleotide dissociation stimulator-like 2 n=1 Tax=Sceloporus undulatus TaxID=8520 RepID=UPI001C4C3FB3|nr:ral guanine nucleotide dissociation stimulator-like 2 [Sceloporus undulatus]